MFDHQVLIDRTFFILVIRLTHIIKIVISFCLGCFGERSGLSDVVRSSTSQQQGFISRLNVDEKKLSWLVVRLKVTKWLL